MRFCPAYCFIKIPVCITEAGVAHPVNHIVNPLRQLEKRRIIRPPDNPLSVHSELAQDPDHFGQHFGDSATLSGRT